GGGAGAGGGGGPAGDPGLLREGGDEPARELLVLPVVDDERGSPSAAAGAERGDEHEERGEMPLHRGYTATVPATRSLTRSPTPGTSSSNVLAATIVPFPLSIARR